MNHGVRKFWIYWTLCLLNFMDLLGTFGKFHLYPWIALEIGIFANFCHAILKILPISTWFGLISFHKGGN